MPTLLALDSVGRRFRFKTAISGISFTVQAGQAVGLVGPSGAGKTTILRLVQGSLRPSSGQVSLLGQAPADASAPSPQVEFLFGGNGLPRYQTVAHHLQARAQSNGLPPQRMAQLVDEFRLAPLWPQRLRHLSEGERARVRLATAMAARPSLLVLDEPFANVDVDHARWIRQVLLRHVTAGRALLVSGSELANVERLVDSVVVVNRHQLYNGPVSQMRSPQCPTLAQAYLDLVSNAPRQEAA